MELMNSQNPQEYEPGLGERVSRLETQVAELKEMLITSVAELKGMIARLETRMDAMERRLDRIETRVDKLYVTVIVTGISVAISIIFGVGAINASLVSGMTDAFQAGDGSARWRAAVERDIGDLKTKFVEMDERQRRDSAELRKDSAELRKDSADMRTEMREIRKLLERRGAPPEPAKR
jgi:uncharacterized coiled-coil protein SlyX